MSQRMLFVCGAGGHGKVVADICLRAGLDVAGFIDDDPTKHGRDVLGLRVLGGEAWLKAQTHKVPVQIALGVGDNTTRQRVATSFRGWGVELLSVVHPSAVLAPSASIGVGTAVMAGVKVNPDATIGEGVILNTGALIEHDNSIGDYAHISGNAAMGGSVHIGARAHVGLGAVVLPNLTVGADCIVGAGAVVTRSVPDGKVMAGVPARPMRGRSSA